MATTGCPSITEGIAKSEDGHDPSQPVTTALPSSSRE